MFVAIPVVAVAGTAIYQRYNAQPTPDTEEGEEEEEQENEETSEAAENKGTVVPAGQDPADKLASQWKASSSQDTWKASAKREEGPDSYVFGDITRGIYSRLTAGFASSDPAQAAVIEADAEEKATQVQRLVRDAVILFRARGYEGSISMTHTVGYFTESARVSVTAPKEAPEPSRWLLKTPPKPTMKPGDGTRAGAQCTLHRTPAPAPVPPLAACLSTLGIHPSLVGARQAASSRPCSTAWSGARRSGRLRRRRLRAWRTSTRTSPRRRRSASPCR